MKVLMSGKQMILSSEISMPLSEVFEKLGVSFPMGAVCRSDKRTLTAESIVDPDDIVVVSVHQSNG